MGALAVAAVASLTGISFYYHALIGAAATLVAGPLISRLKSKGSCWPRPWRNDEQ